MKWAKMTIMSIKKPNIKVNHTRVNYNKMSNKKNKYIVIHYTGSTGSAYNNTRYFKTSRRGASANYFVDDDHIYECVSPKYKAWHCGDHAYSGTSHPYYKKCTNANSIGIEMCCLKKDGKLMITNKTIANVRLLVLWLMQEYDIPSSHIIRHYDVSGKRCPNANGLLNDAKWQSFKKKITKKPIKVTVKKYYSTTGKYQIIKVPRAIRRGPSINYPIVGYINEQNSVYTITKVNGKYGKLKSGVGYICLRNDYVKKV